MRVKMKNDQEFTDHRIESVDGSLESGWSMQLDNGFSFWCPAGNIEPKPGDTARLYGKGIGYVVRGLFISGREVFYRTPEQEEVHRKEEAEKARQERRYDFEKSRASLDQKFDSLPQVFQGRIAGLRRRNADFRWEYESYEVFVCTEAVKIADAVRGRAASDDKLSPVFAEFRAMEYEQQVEFAALSDGHSGNTFGISCRLAWWYMTDPENVAKEHGALCPLVGCAEYGCFATEKK